MRKPGKELKEKDVRVVGKNLKGDKMASIKEYLDSAIILLSKALVAYENGDSDETLEYITDAETDIEKATEKIIQEV